VGRPITAATAGRELQADIQNNAGCGGSVAARQRHWRALAW